MILRNFRRSVIHGGGNCSFDADDHGQFEYANNLLYLVALFLLKGVHFLLQRVTIRPKPKLYVPAVVMSGMLGFLFAAAFECNAPDFWAIRSGKCFNQVSL
jgi:hypothetical protein